MLYKSHKNIIPTKIISILITVLLLFSVLQVQEIMVNAQPSFSNPATLEADFKGVFQSNFNSMSSTFSVTVTGNANLKNFFETDSNGDIITVPKLQFKSTFGDWFSEQLTDMKAGNYNAYTRLALEKYEIGVTISGQSELDSATITTNLFWRDGANPLQARNTVKNHVTNFLTSSAYTSKTTDDAKLKAINKYICETFQYDYRLFVPAETDDVNYTAYNMLNDTGAIGGYKRGVCQAYAMYGYMMLKEAGYESITISGEAGTPRGPHAWNMVKVNGKWYHIDFTWNDPIKSNNPEPYVKRQTGVGSVGVNYFMRSDSEIKINHYWEAVEDGYTYPLSSSEWSGTPPIVNVTQPIPSPTLTPIPTTPPVITVAPSPTSTVVSSKMSSVSSLVISTSDVSEESLSESEDTSSLISENNESENKSEALVENDISLVLSNEKESLEEAPTTVYISGQLLDGDGNPLSGMTMKLFATNQTVITDENGMYEFKNVNIGSYKIWIEDFNGEQIGELPIVISFGDKTKLNEGGVQIKGETLEMNLTFADGKLTIASVSHPKKLINSVTFILIIIGILVIIGIVMYFVLEKKGKYEIED